MPMTRAEAQALDEHDALACLRAAFAPLDSLYLDGHSLGPPTRASLARVARTAGEDWSGRLVRAWNETPEGGWIDLPARAASKIARLIGVAPQDVVVADSVSVNLFKLAAALLQPGKAIGVFDGEFPTDGYVMEGLAGLAAAPFVRLGRDDQLTGRNIGVLIKSAVDYRTAATDDFVHFEAAAREIRAAVIWDLSHATGVLALDLARDGVRFAVGCGYKYLNGGPGAPAFLYCRSDAAARLSNPVAGWFGHSAPFEFAQDYLPAPGARRFHSGTPPILSLAALDAALELFEGIDMAAVEAKARALRAIFLARVAPLGLAVVGTEESGLAPARTGGHVGLRHEDGYAVIRCLTDRGVCGDFRAPDLMRFGFSPLYLRHVDAYDAAEALKDVVGGGTWRHARYQVREKVT